ncbi:hypothetical protein LY76DRAFT_375692 [Colletotrichum caudatum]|nr:hypothetical protein LY76DRAFT_375692 [Colletotrichum caudatum]
MRQPVQSLLDRLNLLGQQLHERDEIVALWRELRLEFLSDPAFHDLQFIPWALQNVHAKTLELVTATIYADDIDSLRADISRRCAAVCARFNSTPGVLIFCFGVTIASSRPCLDALNSLQKSHPDVSVPQLYHRYLMTPTDGPGRKGTNKDLARVRLAIQDFNPDIWTKQHSTRARSQSVVSEPASKPEAELHFNLDAVTGAPVVASAEQDLAINLGDDFRGGNDDDSDDDDCSDNNVDINMDDDKDEQHGYEDMTSIEAQRGTGKRAESAVQKKTLFGAATAERRDCESNSPFFRCGTDDNDSYEDAAAGLGDDDDDQFYPDTEHDESSLFEQQSAVGGLHDGLTTIPEETSTQLIATDTPEQSRRNNLLPTARSFQDHWTCDSPPPLEYISTADALSPVRSLSDSIQTRRPKKRSLSVSDILANSAGPSVDLGVSAPQKKRMIFIPSPEMKRTKSTEEKSKRRTMLEFTMDGIATLMPGAWVNDQVINTLSQRLTSATVGVVDSIVFCASRNAKLQLHLRPIVTKEVVLIFLHEPGHWILFRWLRASGVLEEYDSLRPSSVKSPTSVDRVKVFLRWACAEDNMAIELRQVEVSGFYTIRLGFPSHITHATKHLPSAHSSAMASTVASTPSVLLGDLSATMRDWTTQSMARLSVSTLPSASSLLGIDR